MGNDLKGTQNDSTVYDAADDGSSEFDTAQVMQDSDIAANATDIDQAVVSSTSSTDLDDIHDVNESDTASKAFESGVARAGDNPTQEVTPMEDFESSDDPIAQS